MRTLFLHVLLMYAAVLADAANGDLLLPAAVGYSAEFQIERGGTIISGKFYSATDRARIETNLSGVAEIVILRRDMHAGYVLMPGRREYQGVSLRSAQERSDMPTRDQMDLTPVYEEPAEGSAIRKYVARMKDGTATGFAWLTRDGIPVKMELVSGSGQSAQRVAITLKNIVVAAQSPSLFELPDNYRSIPSLGSLGMSGGSSVW